MAADNATKVRGVEMDDQEIDRSLTELGHGTLAMARKSDAYSVPVAFGYDGDRIFLYLIRFGDESRKLDFLQETDQACLMAYRVDSQFDWRSVLVTGTLQEMADDGIEYMEDVMDDNAWFPTLYPPTSEITGVQRVRLQIDEATGRKGKAYQ